MGNPQVTWGYSFLGAFLSFIKNSKILIPVDTMAIKINTLDSQNWETDYFQLPEIAGQLVCC